MPLRSRFSLAVVILLGCTPDQPLAPQLQASANAPAVMVTGSVYFATLAGGINHTQLTARRWTSGAVDGEWQVSSNGPVIHGRVTCVVVEGSVVRVSGIVERTRFTTVPVGSGFGWQISDEGQGGADRATRLFFPADTAVADTFCRTGAAPVTLIFFNGLGGNVTIHR